MTGTQEGSGLIEGNLSQQEAETPVKEPVVGVPRQAAKPEDAASSHLDNGHYLGGFSYGGFVDKVRAFG